MTYTESTYQAQPITIEELNKSIEELNKKDVSFYKALALSRVDIIRNPYLIDKMNDDETN